MLLHLTNNTITITTNTITITTAVHCISLNSVSSVVIHSTKESKI
jgi:hypothetical protein